MSNGGVVWIPYPPDTDRQKILSVKLELFTPKGSLVATGEPNWEVGFYHQKMMKIRINSPDFKTGIYKLVYLIRCEEFILPPHYQSKFWDQKNITKYSLIDPRSTGLNMPLQTWFEKLTKYRVWYILPSESQLDFVLRIISDLSNRLKKDQMNNIGPPCQDVFETSKVGIFTGNEILQAILLKNKNPCVLEAGIDDNGNLQSQLDVYFKDLKKDFLINIYPLVSQGLTPNSAALAIIGAYMILLAPLSSYYGFGNQDLKVKCDFR
jgi:hypothetical protein